MKAFSRSLRLRFSLRTLLVVVTVLCVWLGYHLNWMRQRRAMAVEHHATMVFRADETTSAPAGLWMLGESGITLIAYCRSAEEPALDRARRLFPEAELTLIEVDRFGEDPSRPPGYLVGGGLF
jgi:hypothetical protein